MESRPVGVSAAPEDWESGVFAGAGQIHLNAKSWGRQAIPFGGGRENDFPGKKPLLSIRRRHSGQAAWVRRGTLEKSEWAKPGADQGKGEARKSQSPKRKKIVGISWGPNGGSGGVTRFFEHKGGGVNSPASFQTYIMGEEPKETK